MKTVTREPNRPAAPPDPESDTDLLVAYMALKRHPWGAMTPIAGDLAGVCLAAQAFVRAFEQGFPTIAAAMEDRHG